MKILHACSSVLIRPNGIVRYINAVADLQFKLGHEVHFASDAKPTQHVSAHHTHFFAEHSSYVPNTKNHHVWLQVDTEIVGQMVSVFKNLEFSPELVIAHDLHSFLAAESVFPDGLFVQHESDVLTSGSRWSFLSDEYLALQLQSIHNTHWRVGLTVHSENVRPRRAIYTPVPFVAQIDEGSERSKGLLYVGDSTERKGAREFMALASDLGVTPTVITSDPNSWLFHGANVHQFPLTQRTEMYELMRQHRVAYIPSKNECPGIAALECLQFMPVVVDSQYSWTRYLDEMGAIRTTGANIHHTVAALLSKSWVAGSSQLVTWSKNAQQFWTNIST
jgi:hypothetical protein